MDTFVVICMGHLLLGTLFSEYVDWWERFSGGIWDYASFGRCYQANQSSRSINASPGIRILHAPMRKTSPVNARTPPRLSNWALLPLISHSIMLSIALNNKNVTKSLSPSISIKRLLRIVRVSRVDVKGRIRGSRV